jgi:hypothetical protein
MRGGNHRCFLHGRVGHESILDIHRAGIGNVHELRIGAADRAETAKGLNEFTQELVYWFVFMSR